MFLLLAPVTRAFETSRVVMHPEPDEYNDNATMTDDGTIIIVTNGTILLAITIAMLIII